MKQANAHARKGRYLGHRDARLPPLPAARRLKTSPHPAERVVPRSTSAALRVLALGPLKVFVGEREITPNTWRNRKAQLVFEYLLTREPGHLVPTDALMEAFWPEEDPALSIQCLRAATSVLRRTLEPDLPCRMPSAYLSSNDGRYALTLGKDGFFDVAEFARNFYIATELDHAGDGAGAASAYRTAINLYRGDFLEDEPYAEWALRRRERLRERFARALIRVCEFQLANGDVAEATDLAVRTLETDPAHEPAYRLIIACYARSGQWGRAKVLYERYCAAMREYDLPTPPSLRTLVS